jgi:hypothetical protein
MASTPQVAPGSETQRKSLVRRLFTWAVIAFVVLVVLVVFAVVNNNYSFHQTTRAEFNAQLDHAIGTSTQWIVRQPDIYGNPSLMFMVGDMAAMSGDPRLHQFVEGYLGSKRVRVPGQPVTWYYARLVDPHAPVPRLSADEAESTVGWEIRWDTYATAPDRMELSQADRSDLFSPTKYYWGRRNHQLLALDIYRSRNGASPELDATLQAVGQGVARDALLGLPRERLLSPAQRVSAGRRTARAGEEALDRTHPRPSESGWFVELLLVRLVPWGV